MHNMSAQPSESLSQILEIVKEFPKITGEIIYYNLKNKKLEKVFFTYNIITFKLCILL